MTHEFEFSGMKVTKPSRMRKVYMSFSCSVMERDVLFTAFHVPTIVIAHITNQGPRALKALLGHVEGQLVDPEDDEDSGSPIARHTPTSSAQGRSQQRSSGPALPRPANVYTGGGRMPVSPAHSHGTSGSPSFDPYVQNGHMPDNAPVESQLGRMGSGSAPQPSWPQAFSSLGNASNGAPTQDPFNVSGYGNTAYSMPSGKQWKYQSHCILSH
eukprot:scaffold310311_cov45-Prasinocladus_malaysianus.AAC.1